MPFWSLVIFFTQEGVEIFEFRQKHIAVEHIIFILLKFQSRAFTGRRSIQGGLGVQVRGYGEGTWPGSSPGRGGCRALTEICLKFS